MSDLTNLRADCFCAYMAGLKHSEALDALNLARRALRDHLTPIARFWIDHARETEKLSKQYLELAQ
jgi:hypothetical protein